MTIFFHARHVRRAHNIIMLLNYFALMAVTAGATMLMIPYMMPERNLSLSFWTPFDPTKTVTIHNFMYAYEVFCAWVATAYNISTDVLVFVVFIIFNFVIASLCERVDAIGDEQRQKQQNSTKIAVYGEMINFIEVHYKFIR